MLIYDVSIENPSQCVYQILLCPVHSLIQLILFSENIPGQVRIEIYVVSGLTYKSREKWKMLWGTYSAIYGEVNVSVEKCVEKKGDYVEK